MDLLVDIGNSRLKWGVDENRHIELGEPVLHNDGDIDKLLFPIWCALPKSPERMAVSCVASNTVLHRVKSTALKIWPGLSIRQIQSEAEAHGVRNAYQHPEKLGTDRWLCLIAARREWRGPVCIADCGTAITVDVLDENGRHQGGLICPGLSLMKQSLSQGTAGLIFSVTSGSPQLADNTADAINNGSLYAAAGMIRTVISSLDKSYHLVLTGGDADEIAPYLDHPSAIAPDLVLKGLSLVLAE